MNPCRSVGQLTLRLKSGLVAIPRPVSSVHVRSRDPLVDRVDHSALGDRSLIDTWCADDDAHGGRSVVCWDYKADGWILTEEGREPCRAP